jgi:hypothetical protein
VWRGWIEHYGVPRALYTDWKNVYVRSPNAQERMRGEVREISQQFPPTAGAQQVFGAR